MAEHSAENARIAKKPASGCQRALAPAGKSNGCGGYSAAGTGRQIGARFLQMVETDLVGGRGAWLLSVDWCSLKTMKWGKWSLQEAPIATWEICGIAGLLYLPSTQIGLIRVGGETQVRVDSLS